MVGGFEIFRRDVLSVEFDLYGKKDIIKFCFFDEKICIYVFSYGYAENVEFRKNNL